MPLKHRGAVAWAKWTLTLKVFLFSVSLRDSAWISFVNYMVWQECDLFYNEMSIMQKGGKGLFKCVKCHTWTPSEWLRINTFNNSPHSLAVTLPTASQQQPHQSWVEYTLCLHGRSFPSEPAARHEPLWTYYFPVSLESYLPVLGTVLRVQYNREITKGIIQSKESLTQGRGLEHIRSKVRGQGRAWSEGSSQSGIPVSLMKSYLKANR